MHICKWTKRILYLLKIPPLARSVWFNLLKSARVGSPLGVAASPIAATLFRNQFPREIEYRRNGALSGRIDHRPPSGTTRPLHGNTSSSTSLFIIRVWYKRGWIICKLSELIKKLCNRIIHCGCSCKFKFLLKRIREKETRKLTTDYSVLSRKCNIFHKYPPFNNYFVQ